MVSENESPEHSSKQTNATSAKQDPSDTSPPPRNAVIRVVKAITPYATLASLIATIVYAFIAGFQLNAMNKQFKAAKNANRINYQSMVTANRPFVVMQSVENQPFTYYNQGREVWGFYPVWINSGNTPARNVRISFEVVPLDKPMSKEFKFQWIEPINQFTLGSLIPSFRWPRTCC
jgi:hypothetical protein